MLLQEAESHCDEVTQIATEQFHIFHGADQLILLHRNTFKFGGVMTGEEVIPGTSNQATSDLQCLMVRSLFRRPPQTWKVHARTCLCASERHDRAELRDRFWVSLGTLSR